MNLPFLRNRASARANRTQSIESELQFHLETETESNVALGMSPEEARRTAHSRLGNAALIREEVYWMSRPRFLEDLKRDIVYALRTFGRDPAVTVAAVLSLALGLGSAITVFSVAYGTLVNSFPY